MSERRNSGILGHVVMTFFGQSSGYVVAVLTGIVVARTLGPAGKGVAAYASLLLAIFTTYGNGLQAAVMYQCGRNGEPVELVYGSALRIIGATMLPCAAVLLALGLLLPAHASLAFLACALPFAVYGQVTMGFFLLKGEIRTTIVQGAFNSFGVALFTIPALLVWHGGITAVLGIWATMFACSGLYAFFRIGAFAPRSNLGTTLATIREQVWFSIKTGSVSLADFLNLRVDVFVVGLMLDARSLGIYSLAVATGELMWQLSRPLAWTTVGRIASAERAEAIALTAKVTRNILAVEAVVGVAIFALAPAAVRLVYGPAFAQSGEVVRWLIPGLVLYAAHGALGYFVMVKEGKPLTILAVQTTSIVACAAITVATIHSFGIFGAALATTITYCFAAVIKAWLFMRYTGTSPLVFTLLQPEDIERYRRLAGTLLARPFDRLMLRRAEARS